MKKLLLLFIPILFIACSDDEGENNQNSEVYGSWQFIRVDTIMDVQGDDMIQYIKDNIFVYSHAYGSTDYFTFDENGTYSHSFMKNGELTLWSGAYEAKDGYLYMVEEGTRIGRQYYMKNGELHINSNFTESIQSELLPGAIVKALIISSVFTRAN
ncbi:MAG: hypothetical protein LBG19_05200 [Prevotellaceae bacterium]|jgi:hypothetical protein|nr:hypothetical protein [Prevotellaceae bacterium]